MIERGSMKKLSLLFTVSSLLIKETRMPSRRRS